MPVIAVAAIVVGAALVAGAKGASAGSTINEQRAQAIQLDAEKRAKEETEAGFEFIEEQLQPFVDIGQESISTLGDEIDELTRPFTTDDFEADPGFQFRVEQGERGINRFLASRGLTTSGRAGKELTRFNQGEATQEFDRAFNRFQTTQGNRFNRLLALSNVGQSATNLLVAERSTATGRNVAGILGSGQNRAQQQSEIGRIENEARRRRGDALAGFFKTSSEAIASGASGGGAGAAGAFAGGAT
jgi:hypothetical protein